MSVIPVHGGAGVEGEAHAGGDEAPGRDRHLQRQRVLQGRESQAIGVVLHEGRGHFSETAPSLPALRLAASAAGGTAPAR